MARPREFDIDAALEKAMDVFWELGYANATLPDLLSGMNLTRGSLYKAFTDKKTLFLRVIDVYDGQQVDAGVRALTAPEPDGWARIFGFFETILSTVERQDYRGCLLCSAIAGPAVFDPDIEESALRSLAKLQRAFETALQGTVPAGSAAALSHMLVTQYVGLRVLSQTKGAADRIRQDIAALKTMTETVCISPRQLS